MSMTAYEFNPGSGMINAVNPGEYSAAAELAYYGSQSVTYVDQGINEHNVRVWDVNISGDEGGTLQYHEVNTPAYARGAEDSVELVCKKDGKRRGSLGVYYA